MGTLTVHTIPGSPYGRSVLAALIEKGVPFQAVGLTPASFRSEEHLASHPFGRVPWIEQDGWRLYETQAILRFIDREYDGIQLAPTGNAALARMDELLNICDAYLFVNVAMTIGFNRIVKPLRFNVPADEDVIASAMPVARTVFTTIAGILDDRAFLVENRLRLADLAIATQFGFLSDAPEFDALIAPHPQLRAWYERIMARPSFSNTSWEHVATMVGFK